jgi:hypothetical protein
VSTIPPPPPPGAPVPLPPPGPPAGRGCWRTGLIGCGIAGIVCLILLITGIVYIRSHPEAMTDFVMGRVEAGYAADVTEQDKTELRAAYAAYREKARRHAVSSRSLDRVRIVLSRTAGSISRDQVHDLTAAFREAAGLPAVPSSPSSPSSTGPPGTPVPPISSGTPGPLVSPTP